MNPMNPEVEGLFAKGNMLPLERACLVLIDKEVQYKRCLFDRL